eukprot:g157.t1
MTLCGHPFDTIKVKLQSQGTGPKFNGAWDATRKTFMNESFVGFYRGLGPPLATVAAFNAVLFSSRGLAESLLRHEDGSPLTITDKTLAGGFAGVAVSFVATPTELLKCRLQTQGSVATATARLVAQGIDPTTVKLYRGPMDVAKHVFNTEGGLFALYRGLSITILREVPGNMAMFGCYEGAKAYFAHRKGLSDASGLDRLSLATAGGIGGAAFWLLCYPFDIIKSKIQVDNVHQPTYGGIYDCAKKTFQWDGLQGFYRGFSPCMVRSVIANATCFVVYEWASGFLSKHFQTKLTSREFTSTEST